MGEVLQGPDGGLLINVRTNLPDGTRVAVSVAQGGNVVIGQTTVSGRTIALVERNYDCPREGDRVRSEPVHVWIKVAPIVRLPVSCPGGAAGPAPCGVLRQTQQIYRALGRRFQRLTGPQVTDGDAGNQIEVRRTYVFPASSCLTSGGGQGGEASILPPTTSAFAVAVRFDPDVLSP